MTRIITKETIYIAPFYGYLLRSAPGPSTAKTALKLDERGGVTPIGEAEGHKEPF